MVALPSLEEPAPGTACERCGLELRVEGFCPECFERSMQAREQALQADLAEARTRARTWQVGRAVRA
jgi:hypothetical protein